MRRCKIKLSCLILRTYQDIDDPSILVLQSHLGKRAPDILSLLLKTHGFTFYQDVDGMRFAIIRLNIHKCGKLDDLLATLDHCKYDYILLWYEWNGRHYESRQSKLKVKKGGAIL